MEAKANGGNDQEWVLAWSLGNCEIWDVVVAWIFKTVGNSIPVIVPKTKVFQLPKQVLGSVLHFKPRLFDHTKTHKT